MKRERQPEVTRWQFKN